MKSWSLKINFLLLYQNHTHKFVRNFSWITNKGLILTRLYLFKSQVLGLAAQKANYRKISSVAADSKGTGIPCNFSGSQSHSEAQLLLGSSRPLENTRWHVDPVVIEVMKRLLFLELVNRCVSQRDPSTGQTHWPTELYLLSGPAQVQVKKRKLRTALRNGRSQRLSWSCWLLAWLPGWDLSISCNLKRGSEVC